MEAVPQPADPVRSAHARRNPTPWNKDGATARENSPYRSHIAPLAGQNSPCSHKMAQFGRFYPCRENFIPLSPATSRAGRTFSRTSPSTITGLIETTPQHDTPSGAMKHFPPQLHTPHRSMKHLSPQRATNDPKSPISPTQGRTFLHNTHHPHNTHPRLGDFSFNHPRQVQANQQSHAIPIRPIPTQPHNPQDSNDQASHHETHLRELHAKLLERWDQVTVPVGGEPEHLPTTLISDGSTPNKNRT